MILRHKSRWRKHLNRKIKMAAETDIGMVAGAIKAIMEFVGAIFGRKNSPEILNNAQAKEDQKTDDAIDKALKNDNEKDIKNSVG